MPFRTTGVLHSFSQRMPVIFSFALLLPTAFVNSASLLLFLSWFTAGNYRQHLRLIVLHPVTRWSTLMLALFIIGMLYSHESLYESYKGLGKYRELLLLPIFLSVLYQKPALAKYVYSAFLVGMILTILLPYAQLVEWIPLKPELKGAYTYFKGRIAGSLFIAFTLYLVLWHMVLDQDKRWRAFWMVIFVLGFFDLFFLYDGRTGQLVFIALMLLFGVQLFRWRGTVLATLALSLLLPTLYYFSPTLHERVDKAWTELIVFVETPELSSELSSVGLRMEFNLNTLEIIRDYPIFGRGTGSFPQAYKHFLEEGENVHGIGHLANNPHNEYLLITAQLGLVGLLLFLGGLFWFWRLSYRLPQFNRYLAQGILLAFMVASLFNSCLRDNNEGLLFVLFLSLAFFNYPLSLLSPPSSTTQATAEGQKTSNAKTDQDQQGLVDDDTYSLVRPFSA